jgi:hypothetical protein
LILRVLPADPAIGYGYGVGDSSGVAVLVFVFVTVDVTVIVDVVEGVRVHELAIWVCL